MSNYFYKGILISDLIQPGTSTLTNFTGFPGYSPASNYSSERPLPFNFSTPTVPDVSTLMNAKFVDFTSGKGDYTVPNMYTSFRMILIGGAGGSGGGGGCGWNGWSASDPPSVGRTSGENGYEAGKGSFTYASTNLAYYILGTPGVNITYTVGEGGVKGNAGGDHSKASMGAGGKGNTGNHGGLSSIIMTLVGGDRDLLRCYANGGYGGSGGDSGGPGAAQGDGREPGPDITNNSGITDDVDYTPLALANNLSAEYLVAANVNPVGYLTDYGRNYTGGWSSTANRDQTPGTSGKPGFIRLYLLR